MLKESTLILMKDRLDNPLHLLHIIYTRLGRIPPGDSEIPHWVIRGIHVLK